MAHPEIHEAAAFVASFLLPSAPSPTPPASPPEPPPDPLPAFRVRLSDLLAEHYEGHWYPAAPLRGSAYRSLNLEPGGRTHPLVLRAAAETGLRLRGDEWGDAGVVVWCDPGSVECRFGDRGYTQLVYDALGHRPTIRVVDGRVVALPAREPSPSSGDTRPRSASPLAMSPPRAGREFAERLASRGVSVGPREERTGGKKKTRRDSGYLSATEALAELQLSPGRA